MRFVCMRKFVQLLLIPLVMMTFFAACRTTAPTVRTADQVDLERFMGDWYVIGNIPTFLEKGIWNAKETYELEEDNRVATTFSFNKDGPDGKKKTYTPTGFVRSDAFPSNAVWGMQFIWPIKAEYVIMYVDDDYQETMIGRSKRDYLWIMHRQPDMPEERLEALIEMAVEEGYDRSLIRRVPHSTE
jgi:apolipoprotein D and lipocalin family protein